MKKVVFTVVAALLLICSAWLFLRQSYKFLPSDAVIKEAKVDEYGLLFLITEDNELYIGGYHTDAIGLYDYGIGQWGVGFELRSRNPFRENGAPILFRSDVVDVFPGYLGFTWLSTDGMLYRFTGSEEGAPIVGNAKKAASLGKTVLYQTTENDVLLLAEDSGTPVQITTDSEDFYFGKSGAIRVLKSGGTLYSTNSVLLDQSWEIQIPSNARTSTVRSSSIGTTYISEDNTLYLHLWARNAKKAWEKIGTDVITNSTQSQFVDYFVTAQGDLVQYRPSLEDTASSQKTVCQINTDGLIKIEGCDYFVVALYADGHYEFITP